MPTTYCPVCDTRDDVAIASHSGRTAKRCSDHQPSGRTISPWLMSDEDLDKEEAALRLGLSSLGIGPNSIFRTGGKAS